MEPIAIIGIGCRFPGAENPEAFWKLLCDGVDAISEIPKTRWDLRDLYDSDPDTPGKMNCRYGGFLPQVDQFDPHFFGISPREATAMDPQQRLLLEVAWEALEDAGQVRDHLAGSRTGVFVGISNNDYSYTHPDYSTQPQGYDLTGNALNIAAGRLSYLFNFKGPAIAIDTACSSSMVAVHLACQSLWNGESTLALAGGVNIIVSPIGHIALSKLKALSPDGRCKAFDTTANGYVRSEGAGCIVLKPLSKALADNDPIYATIRGSAVNHDGRSKGLTVPYGPAQEALIRQALDNAGVAPSEISYIEAHGTGTPLGDPIEMMALGSVLATDRQEENYCAVGAVKTNIGHLEAAAGIASLIKVALSLKHQQLPPSLHFENPNPYIPFDTLPLRVQKRLSPWPEQFGLAKAGVSSFGFAGTNAHVILEQAPPSQVRDQARPLKPPYLLPLSAHSPEAVKSLAKTYQDYLATQDLNPTLLEDICYTASVRRTHHKHRLALVVNSPEDAKERLQDLLQDPSDLDLAVGSKRGNRRPKVVFVCSGQGPQWWGMGRELLQSEPVFRGAIEECDALIRSQANWSLLAELTADESQSRLGETEIAQPAIFSLQIALARLWRSWGIEPKAVVGHSLGEVAAAHIAGTLSLTDAVRLICDRGRLMQQATGNGKMAALELSVADTEHLLSECDRIFGSENPNLGIAAINSPTSTVVSGESRAMELFLEFLGQRQPDVFYKLLPVNYAFHSSQMAPFQEELVQRLEGLEPKPENIPVYSTVTGCASQGSDFDATYWGQNIRQAVRFAPAIEALVEAGHTIFLEISPHPVLSGYIAQILDHLNQAGVVVPSLRRSQEERATMLTSLGKLYTQGFRVAWHKLFRSSHCRVVSLPSYPWQEERYWVEQKSQRPSQRPQAFLSQENPDVHPLLGQRLRSPLTETLFESQLTPEVQRFLVGHQVYGMVVLPGAAYLEMALAAGAKVLGSNLGSGSTTLKDVVIQEALVIPEDASRTTQLILTPDGTGEALWRIVSLATEGEDGPNAWTQHAIGKICVEQTDGQTNGETQLVSISIEDLKAKFPEELSVKEYYQQLRQRGLEYGSSFQGIEQLWRQEGEALGRIQLPEELVSQAQAYQLHPVLMDSGLQLLFATLSGDGDTDTYLPVGLDSLRVYRRPENQLWIYGQMRPQDGLNQESRTADLKLLDNHGQVIAELEGLHVKRAKRQALLHTLQDDFKNWLYEVEWQPKTRLGQILPADYFPSPSQISDRIQPHANQLQNQHGLEIYEDILVQLEAFSGAYVVSAFQKMGWQFPLNESITVVSLAQQLGIIEPHHRLFGRMLDILAEEGILTKINTTQWQVSRVPDPQFFEQKPTDLLAQYPAYDAEFTLLERCGEKLAEVVQGKCDPIQLLFPDGSFTSAEKLYQESPGNRVFNLLIQKAVSMAVEKLPKGRTIRVLEIGAGTGGTTSYVASQLPANRTDYVFTDLSHLFMAKAEEKFRDYPFIRYQILDIEQDIEAQGFASNQFDLILASNVIHATSDLRHTMIHVQQLLAPEGMVMLLEGTGRQRWLDLIFGLTEGWWKFTDTELRPDYPLLTPYQWQDLLEDIGFAETGTIPEAGANSGSLSHQSIILAQTAQLDLQTEQQEMISLMPGQGSSWLIFADNKGIGQHLAAQLSSRGETCTMVFPSTSYQQLGEGQYQINPEQPEDFQQLLKAVTTSDTPPCRGVVHLWSLNTVDPAKMTVADLETASVLGCRSVLQLLQSMVKAEFSNLPSLWLVTQGAKQVSAQPTPLAVAQSPLWGLGKVITLEHPELDFVQVDLDPLGQDDQAKALFEELWLDDNEGENNLVLRQGQRYVPRLVRHRQQESTPVELHSDGTYWITGGLGGLGLVVAQWLVAHGARHLVLVGRSGASDQAKVTLKELEDMGAKILVAQADASQTEQVKKVLGEIEVCMPPLKGVIHAAGVLEVGRLEQQNWQDFAKVLAPKVQGAWNLHVLTQHIPLDFFILFSSIASLIGSPGQGNHAAANTFLDTLANYRQTQGLPGLSINWGAWSDLGAVAKRNLSKMSSMRGLGTIAPKQGLQVLEQIFHNPSAQIGVMPIEWSEFLQQFSADNIPPLLTELTLEATTQVVAEETSTQAFEFIQALQKVPPHQRHERLLSHIRDQVSKVLGWSSSHTLDPHQGFFDIGMDSLTSVELRNRLQTSLGRSLSSTLIFDYPTIDALAGYLVSEMFTEEEQEEETDSAETTQKDDHPTQILTSVDVEQLSEEDAEALLLMKLESISV